MADEQHTMPVTGLIGWLKSNWLMVAVVAGFALALGCGIGMSVQQTTRFASDCEARGGRVYDAGRDWLCLDSDGRVIPL